MIRSVPDPGRLTAAIVIIAWIGTTRGVAEDSPEGVRALIVAADGSGDFRTVQAAVDAVPDDNGRRVLIRIRPGVYNEKIRVPSGKDFVSFVGEDAETTILTYNLSASQRGPDGREVGTAGSPSTEVRADDFSAEDITFENSAGQVGQAVAFSIYGDRAVFRRCRFLGWQDTLLVYEGRQYFRDCTIAGHVDFIFGRSTAFFENCEVHCRGDGWITAAKTDEDRPFGFVFSRCRITAAECVRTYLGRPWDSFANVTFLRCDLCDAVDPAGWHNWDHPEREETARFAEYQNAGPGARPDARVSWSRQLADDGAAAMTREAVLHGEDGWNPESTD